MIQSLFDLSVRAYDMIIETKIYGVVKCIL